MRLFLIGSEIVLPSETKKPTWESTRRRSPTSAYSLTNPTGSIGVFFI